MAQRPVGTAVKDTAPAKQPRQHSLVWLQGLLCGAMVTLATPTALLLGVLLAPALLALMMDRQPGRPRARSIALCGMAASVNPLRALWASDHSISHATTLLGNSHVLGAAWSAAAAGWLLAEIAPIGVRAALEALGLARAARLRATRAKLVEEWGFEQADTDQ